MASQTYKKALAEVLRWEGGYVNHPKDPGGATMKGVTQAVYDGYRQRKGQGRRPVKQIADAELQDIYRRQYWNAVKGDDLPAGLDLAVFDFAVNSGPSRAAKFLQAVLGVKQDGQIGEATLAAARGQNPEDLAAKLCDRRLAWLRTLTTFSTFGKGWTSRVKAIRALSISLAEGGEIEDRPAAPAPRPTPRAEATDQSLTGTVTGKGVVTTGAATAGQAITEAADKIAPLGEIGLAFKIVFAVVLLIGVGLTIYGIMKTLRSSEKLA